MSENQPAQIAAKALGLGIDAFVFVKITSHHERAAAHEATEIVKPNFEQAIPNLPGKSLVAVEVQYPPGAASVPHVHAKSAFIYAYVVSGAIESKVNDGEVRVYHAGESWSELPGARHVVSRNASKTEPAKLLAVFVVDSDDKELTTPVR